MIDRNPFPNLPPWHPPEELLKLELPTPKLLAEFIHGCSPDSATRTAATTALVLSLWQLAGRAMTPHVPSMLLLSAGEAATDPIDDLVQGLVYDEENDKPRVQTEGPFTCAGIDLAPTAMKNALLKRGALGRNLDNSPSKQASAENLEERFHAAQVTGFGPARCRPYSQAWHSDYGLLTNRDNELILRLNEDADRESFCRDVLDDPGKLLFPAGIGGDLAPVTKSVSLSGSLPPGLWKDRLAANIVALGLPVFFLPHPAEGPLILENQSLFESLAMSWPYRSGARVETPLRLPASDWVANYQSALRKRLGRLPAAYEFSALQAVRQLGGVCDRIASFADQESKAKPAEVIALFENLYAHSLRGMVIGVAGLAWHGIGFDPGCPRKKALEVLCYIRAKGPVKLSDLLLAKGARINAATRTVLLERLASEDLVRVEGKTVTATTYKEFLRALYARKEFPEVANHWAAVAEDSKHSA
jgi:hypothetical protein